MPALGWRLTEDEAYLETVKHVERWTKRVPVLTPDNIEEFAGLKISTEKSPTSIFLAVYGVGGSGKTTLCSEIVNAGEDGAPALLVDIDRSSSSVVHLQEKGLRILPISTWDEAKKLKKAFEKGGTPWKSVIWDNISELLSLCVRHYAPSGLPQGSDVLKVWGIINAELMEFTRDMRTFCSRDGINLFMVLWEETEKDLLTETVRIKVLLNPKFAAAFPGMATLVGRLTVPGTERSEYVRLLNFAPEERLDTKFRVAPQDEAAKIPLKLYLRQHSNFVVDYLNTVKHGKPFPVEKYKKPGN